MRPADRRSCLPRLALGQYLTEGHGLWFNDGMTTTRTHHPRGVRSRHRNAEDLMPRIRDLIHSRTGQVLYVTPGEGAMIQWSPGWAEWMPKDKLNSGRYEMV